LRKYREERSERKRFYPVRETILMMEECRAHKLPDPIFREESGGFSVSFFNTSYKSELQIPGLTPRQQQIVEFVMKNGSITNEQ